MGNIKNLKTVFAKSLVNLVPKKFRKLVSTYSLDTISIASPCFKISYSQHGEDVFLQNILTDKNGFYVDVGAYHPVIYSNTHSFYLRGWRGINIEPNPDSIEEFRRQRPGDINLNIAISGKESIVTYYKFNYGAVNTISYDHAKLWANKPGYSINQQLEVKSYPLAKVFHEHVPTGTTIDLLSVDCEGFDLEVLKSNDWDLYRPNIVVAEFIYYDYNDYRDAELYKFLESVRYEFLGIVGISVFFGDIDRKKV
jgi:FkbM family methyltransferase